MEEVAVAEFNNDGWTKGGKSRKLSASETTRCSLAWRILMQNSYDANFCVFPWLVREIYNWIVEFRLTGER